MIDLVTGDQVFFGWIGVTANDSMTLLLSVRRTDHTHATLRGTVTGNGDRTRQSIRIPVPYDCELVSCAVRQTAGTPPTQPGATWVDAFVERDGPTNNVATLIQGYFYDGHDLSYPVSLQTSKPPGPTGDRGRVYTAAGTNPAAGAEVADTVPTGARWRLYAAEVVLVTDATVANRNTALFIDDAGGTITRRQLLTDTTNQTASQTRTHGWYPGTAAVDAASTSITDTVTVLAKFPMTLPTESLLAGYKIRTVTTGIVAGDDYGAARYIVEEWLS